MKNMYAALGTLLISSTLLAANCSSLDLNEGKNRINSIEGLSAERQQLHLQILKNAKVTQILACVGLKETISKSDAEFAITELIANKEATIRSIEANLNYLISAAQKPEISAEVREAYVNTMDIALKQLTQLKQNSDPVIAKIKKLTE